MKKRLQNISDYKFCEKGIMSSVDSSGNYALL